MSTTTISPDNNNNSTTTAPSIDKVITTELLLAILVPCCLIVMICGIACFRYFKNQTEIENEEKHQILKRGFIPADAPLELTNNPSTSSQHQKRDGITRLGVTETSSINAVNGRNNSSNSQGNDYYSYENDGDEYYNEDDYYEEEEEYNNSDNYYQTNNNSASAANNNTSTKNGKKSVVSPLDSHRFSGIKRYDPDASSGTENTTDYDSETSPRKLPPAPGEAAIINPFGRANVHTKIARAGPVSNNNNNTTGAAATTGGHRNNVISPSKHPPLVKRMSLMSMTDL